MLIYFFFNATATTEIYTLSLHDALPICRRLSLSASQSVDGRLWAIRINSSSEIANRGDRKSTRLNSSHSQISYAVFCLKKKNQLLKVFTSGPKLAESIIRCFEIMLFNTS